MTKRHSYKGFTLIELLIVIAIIGVLAGLGGIAAQSVSKMARRSKAKTVIDSLSLALDQYKNDVGIYPPDDSSTMVMNHLTGFKESTKERSPDFKNDRYWNGPYYEAKKKEFKGGAVNAGLIDPWNQVYRFRLKEPERNPFKFDVYSTGPNQIDDNGAGDDIGNW
jgi:general secretion pathway protein G